MIEIMKENIEKLAKGMQEVREKYEPLVEKWVSILGLDNWDIYTDYYPSINKDSPDCLADTSVHWQYMHGTLRCFMPNLIDVSDIDLERNVVHELLHFIVNEMREWDNKDQEKSVAHEERVVVMLTRAMLKAATRN